MNKRRCECYSKSQYVVYQNECRPVKCSTLSSSIRQKVQIFLWTRVFFVLHVTRQFKSLRNLVAWYMDSNTLMTLILENVMMFLWTQGDFGDNDHQVVEQTFYGRFVRQNSEDWAIYRENHLYITYIAHFESSRDWQFLLWGMLHWESSFSTILQL